MFSLQLKPDQSFGLNSTMLHHLELYSKNKTPKTAKIYFVAQNRFITYMSYTNQSDIGKGINFVIGNKLTRVS